MSPAGNRRVHVHLEPEPDPASRRPSPSGACCGRGRRAAPLVAARRGRRDGHDAVPRPRGGRPPAARARVGGRGPAAAAVRGAPRFPAAGRRRRASRSWPPATSRSRPRAADGFTETRAILDYLGGGGRCQRSGPSSGSGWWAAVRHLAPGRAGHGPAARLRGGGADRRGPGHRGRDRRPGGGPGGRPLAARRSLALVRRRAGVFAPSLATVTPGLPNDHYHAFLDPLVLAVAGVGPRAPGGRGRGRPSEPGPRPGREHRGRGRGCRGRDRAGAVVRRSALAGGLTVVLVVIGVTAWPPRVAEDGGWLLVDDAAARVARTAGDRPVLLDGIPPFKSADALRFPLLRNGRGCSTTPRTAPGRTRWSCATRCSSSPSARPAEVRRRTPGWPRTRRARGLRLVDRFEAGPRRVISVYAPGRHEPPGATSRRGRRTGADARAGADRI